MSQSIAVQDLRVGMFVHIDLAWMKHPFALSSFRIRSADEIETIRGLGVSHVRWDPAQSLSEAQAAEADAAADSEFVEAQHSAAAPLTDGPASPHALDLPATPRERRRRLAAQHDAAKQRQQQYKEVAAALHESQLRALTEPEAARRDTETLARALTDKMLVDGEMCIRLLTSGAGDRTTAHALNVTVISMLMGRSLGLPEPELMDLGVGAMLHDVGKFELPERVRHMDARLNADEVAAYRSHVARSVAIGRRMALGEGPLMVLAQHHEMADGSGFPLQLHSERMTVAARIVALVDSYDLLCNPGALDTALTPHEALSTLFAQSRSKFDVSILNAFIRMMGVYPAGSIVQLTDDRYAMVVGVNSTRPLKPRVLVYDPKVAPEEALYLNLERATHLGIRRSLNPIRLPTAALDYLAPRPRVSYYFEPIDAERRAYEALA